MSWKLPQSVVQNIGFPEPGSEDWQSSTLPPIHSAHPPYPVCDLRPNARTSKNKETPTPTSWTPNSAAIVRLTIARVRVQLLAGERSMWSSVAALLAAAAAGGGATVQTDNNTSEPSQSSSVCDAVGSTRSSFCVNGGASSSRNAGVGHDTCAGRVDENLLAPRSESERSNSSKEPASGSEASDIDYDEEYIVDDASSELSVSRGRKSSSHESASGLGIPARALLIHPKVVQSECSSMLSRKHRVVHAERVRKLVQPDTIARHIIGRHACTHSFMGGSTQVPCNCQLWGLLNQDANDALTRQATSFLALHQKQPRKTIYTVLEFEEVMDVLGDVGEDGWPKPAPNCCLHAYQFEGKERALTIYTLLLRVQEFVAAVHASTDVPASEIASEDWFRKVFRTAPELQHIEIACGIENFGRCSTCTRLAHAIDKACKSGKAQELVIKKAERLSHYRFERYHKLH
eukprot:3343115-Pleurochrysis_carterae.AAC.1